VGPSTGVALVDRKASSASPLQLSAKVSAERAVEHIPDDRENLKPDDAVLLIVEDDPHYARVLCDLSRDKGFKVLVATRGSEALALAREFHPTAVSLATCESPLKSESIESKGQIGHFRLPLLGCQCVPADTNHWRRGGAGFLIGPAHPWRPHR